MKLYEVKWLPNFVLQKKLQFSSHSAKDLLMVKKVQPGLVPSRTVPVGCVDLNYRLDLRSVIGLGRYATFGI